MDVGKTLPCDIEDVIDITGIKVVRDTGTQLHCRCPFCDDRKAHMNVRLGANVFRCNRCGRGGGVLHLYAYMYDVSLKTAYDELCRVFGTGEKVRLPEQRAKTAKKRVKKESQELPLASSAVRNNTYSNLLSLLSLGANHRESLIQRGLSGDDIVKLGYRTTPAVRSAKIVAELIDRGCDLRGVPGFYCDSKTGQWKLDIRASGIMLPDRNSNGEIEAIQIRLDKVYKSKFNNLTSTEQYYGATAACCPHFVGVTEDTDVVYLTEGVMKADIAHCISVELGQPRAFVGLTGVRNLDKFRRALGELDSMGIHRINVVFDMDELTNKNVREAKAEVLEVGSEAGFEMTPVSWNPAYKGIDDLLASFKERRKILEAVHEQSLTIAATDTDQAS